MSYTTVKAEIKTYYPGHTFEYGTWDDRPHNTAIINIDSPDKDWDDVLANGDDDPVTLTERVAWVSFDKHEFVDMEALTEALWRNLIIVEIVKRCPEDFLTLVFEYSFETRAHWYGYDEYVDASLVGVLDTEQPFPVMDLSKLPLLGKDFEVLE